MAGLALCSAITGGHSDYPVIYNIAFVCMLVFELVLICALAIRGLIRFKQFGWQFSLRTLLIVTTLAAIALGFTVYAISK
jgi:cytochrome b subunit of formate dehydrogenase